jgi:hypothetical protein
MASIYVVPHFHYDVAWIKTEEEYLEEVYRILQKVIHIMDVDSQFKYTLDQTYYLEKIKEEKPELFKAIAKRVAEGRIEIVNAGYTMLDLNLVSPHTIKKSFQLANEFAEREFGVQPKVAWMIDCSGHHGLMPKLARDMGLNYYVFWRGMNNVNLTQEFIWRGADGTEIIAHWLKYGYSLFPYRYKELTEVIKVCKPTTDKIFIPFGADFYLPEEKFIEQVHRNKEAKFATPSEFFTEIEKQIDKLPVVEGEMLSDYCNFRGVYSSRPSYKRLFRSIEERLISYPQATDDDWKDLIYCGFHDLICGTGIDKTYPPAIEKLNKLKSKIPIKEVQIGKKTYKGEFLKNISFQLSFDHGDLYHTKPEFRCYYQPEKLEINLLEDGCIELDVDINFKQPHHKLQLVIKSGIREGNIIHHLDGHKIERQLNTIYPLVGYFEYWDKKRTRGLQIHGDCFDYEVKNNGDIFLTLIRSVSLLSHGDAGPPIECPDALEQGMYKFKIFVRQLGD